jgi:hypothetical protein
MLGILTIRFLTQQGCTLPENQWPVNSYAAVYAAVETIRTRHYTCRHARDKAALTSIEAVWSANFLVTARSQTDSQSRDRSQP